MRRFVLHRLEDMSTDPATFKWQLRKQDVARQDAVHPASDEPCPCCRGDRRTVCDACGEHACWAGLFMCGDAQTAGVRQIDG